MSYSTSTPNYKLPLFIASDKPSWLGDWNDAMTAIDNGIAANNSKSQNALDAAEASKALSDANQESINTINQTLVTNGEAINHNAEAIGEVNETLGTNVWVKYSDAGENHTSALYTNALLGMGYLETTLNVPAALPAAQQTQEIFLTFPQGFDASKLVPFAAIGIPSAHDAAPVMFQVHPVQQGGNTIWAVEVTDTAFTGTIRASHAFKLPD